MKNRALLSLMEQLIMVLVFSLAAAVCLRLFGAADVLALETARRDEAVLAARNAAELLKAGYSSDRLAPPEGYRLDVREEETHLPGLGLAQIDVYYEEELLFTLSTGWQEVAP